MAKNELDTPSIVNKKRARILYSYMVLQFSTNLNRIKISIYLNVKKIGNCQKLTRNSVKSE